MCLQHRKPLIGLGLGCAVYKLIMQTIGVEDGNISGARIVYSATRSVRVLSVIGVRTNSVMYIKVRYSKNDLWDPWNEIQGTFISRVAQDIAYACWSHLHCVEKPSRICCRCCLAFHIVKYSPRYRYIPGA